jgi:geranylgeranyl pyrophosphate synthase
MQAKRSQGALGNDGRRAAGRTLKAIVDTGREVEGFLADHSRTELSRDKGLAATLDYVLPDIGLRLRPYLLRISYEAGGGSFKQVLPVAAGIELIQLSTLVIDDVLDDSLVRNGKPSVYGKLGAGHAVSAGIVISSLGLSLIANSLERIKNYNNASGVMKLILAAHTEIYMGQFMDLSYEDNIEITEPQYIDMISKTTACFIRAPLLAGAMLWGAPKRVISIMERGGLSLGLAYQLRDDVVDIVGRTELTGKPLAGDIRQRKMRLPVIHALKWSVNSERKRLTELLQKKRQLTDAEITDVSRILMGAGSIEYCIAKTKKLCGEAAKAISALPKRYTSLSTSMYVVANMISSFEDTPILNTGG